MVILIQFVLYVCYFFIKLYSLLDKKCIFSINGGKLKKYISEDAPQNITYNLGKAEKNFFSNSKLSSWSSNTFFIKVILNTIFLTLTIFIIKICFTYSLLFSNFLYINIFNKNIDIVSFLGEKFILFKFIYYFTYIFLIFNIVYVIVYKYYLKKENKLKLSLKDMKYNSVFVKIGTNISNDLTYSKNQDSSVIIDEKGLYQNILITGSIGSGKTSSAISNILLSLIKSDIYGLIIDVKGNFIQDLREMLIKNNLQKEIVEISLNSNFLYNPLNNNKISSIEMASRIKQVLLNLTKNNNSDSYWLDKSEEYIRDFITIIRAYTNVVTFKELHTLVIDKEYLYEKINVIRKNFLNNKYTDDELFNINSAILNINNEYLKLDERTISIIKSEITRVTNVFMADKSIYDAFCSTSDEVDFLSNKIYVLSLNIGENRVLTKIISSYLKLDYQKQILSQKTNFKKTFFVSDEYQEIATEDDANFFSLSRQYKSINVISMQSYSSLLNTLTNENAARVIIQNLVNKIWFRNDDMYTVSEIIKQIGKEEKKKETINYSESSQNSKYSLLLNKFKNYKSGLSKSISISDNDEYLLNEEYITRKLKTFEACMMISNGVNMQFIKKVRLKRWDIEDEGI